MDVSLLDVVLTQVEQAEARTRKQDKDTETTQKKTLDEYYAQDEEGGKEKVLALHSKHIFQEYPC